jgi:hypothetical protein
MSCPVKVRLAQTHAGQRVAELPQRYQAFPLSNATNMLPLSFNKLLPDEFLNVYTIVETQDEKLLNIVQIQVPKYNQAIFDGSG